MTQPTDDKRIDHLKTHLKTFLQNDDESLWGCPSTNSRGGPCRRQLKNQQDIFKVAYLLLSVVEPEACAGWNKYKFHDFDDKLLKINDFIDSVACTYHNEHLKEAVSNYRKKTASSSRKPNLSSGIASSEESVSTTFKNQPKDGASSPSATIQPRVTNHTYGMETPPRPTGRHPGARYPVGSNTPTRPTIALIQPSPESTYTPLSDTKSFASSSDSVFTPGDLGELTPFTPPSTTPSSEPRIAVLESQGSPSLARSARRVASQSSSTTKPKFDLSKLQNNGGLRSPLDEGAEDSFKHTDVQRALFDDSAYKNGGALKRTTTREYDYVQGISDVTASSPPQRNEPRDRQNPKEWSPSQNKQVNSDGSLSEFQSDIKIEDDGRNTAATASGLTSCSLDGAEQEVVIDENALQKLDAAPKVPCPLKLETYRKKPHKTLIYEIIEKPPGERSKKEGLVYVAIHKDWVSQDNRQLIKIGFTTKSVPQRYKPDKCKGMAKNALFVAEHSKKFKGADWVEQLVHAYLDDERYKMTCPDCDSQHEEWFISTQDKVLHAVRLWTGFVKMSPDPAQRLLAPATRKVLADILGKDRLEAELGIPKAMSGLNHLIIHQDPMPLHRMTHPSKFVHIQDPVQFVANDDTGGQIAKTPSKVEPVVETNPRQVHDNSTSRVKLEDAQNQANDEGFVVQIDKSSQGYKLTFSGLKKTSRWAVGKAIEAVMGATTPTKEPADTKKESGSRPALLRSDTWKSFRSR